MSRCCYSMLCILAVAPALRGGDLEVDQPYQLRLIVLAARDPVLSAAFRERFERELLAQVRLALGKLARVSIETEHPLLAEINAKGLEALDGWSDLDGKKTAFVLVDHRDGRYQIATRQYDGLTGLSSPLRRAGVLDRLLVARSAALLIDRDFAPVAAVGAVGPKAEVDINVQGGRLDAALRRRIGKDLVFAVVQINRVGGELKPLRVPWTLLQVSQEPDEQGVCKCRVWQRYRDSLAAGPALVELRAILLSTTRGPLRLTLVDEEKRKPLADEMVAVSRLSFANEPVEKSLSSGEGLVQTRDSFSHVAFVQVLSGDTVRARVPVEIIEGQTLVCGVNVDPRAEVLGRLDLQRKQWLSRLYESVLVVDQLYQELSKLVDAQAHQQALERAERGVKALEQDIASRATELKSLHALARELDAVQHLNVVEGEERLKELSARHKELLEFIDNTKEVIRQESDPKRAELLAMMEQARLAETEADYDKALDLYQKLEKRAENEAKVLAHVTKKLGELKAGWKLRGDDHRRARLFIYEIWARIEKPAELKQHLDHAVEMFERCKEAKDRLTPRMLLKANLAHANRLKQRLEALRPRSREDDRREAEIIAEVGGRLQKLTEDVSGYLSPPP
ncbi:MAG: hypothetical protein AB7K24_20745 [Gemmataceae bacterium]